MRLRTHALRRDRHGVTPVLAEFLMVAMTAGMSASVYIIVDGVTHRPVDAPTYLNIIDNGILRATASPYGHLNDTVLEVTVATGQLRHWDTPLTFQIFAADVLVVQGDLVPAPSDPALVYAGIYHGSPDEPSIVNIGFVDLDRNSVVTAPDHIEIRGMSKEYRGATLMIFAVTVQIAQHDLP